MNKKLLFTDIIILAICLSLLCVVQLMMSFNTSLLTNIFVLISFALGLIVFSTFIMFFSYKENTNKVSVVNLVIHIFSGLMIYIFYSIPALSFNNFYGLGFSIFITFLGLFASRFAFSLSIYLEKHKAQKEILKNTGVFFELGYSRNVPNELHERMRFVGCIILIVCIIGLIYNTFDPSFSLPH